MQDLLLNTMKNHGYPATQNNPFFFSPISNISPLSDVTAILSQENKKALYLHG